MAVIRKGQNFIQKIKDAQDNWYDYQVDISKLCKYEFQRDLRKT